MASLSRDEQTPRGCTSSWPLFRQPGAAPRQRARQRIGPWSGPTNSVATDRQIRRSGPLLSVATAGAIRSCRSYTDRSPDNVAVESGHLTIRARRESYTGPDGVTRMYTSARLHTQHRYSTTYGRVEARIKLPAGTGLWPAFWMLGDNFGEVGWPLCGEIDIMEHVGSEPGIIHAAVHGPGYAQQRNLAHVSAAYSLPQGQRFADDFHQFAIEREPGVVRFYVDQFLYSIVTESSLPPGATWAFNHAFFLLLNVAVGGEWPGPPDASTTFPQLMQVDYVRVYKRR